MHLNKRVIIFTAISALLAPNLSFALDSAPVEASGGYNMALLSMVGLILILLFVIGMLANTLRQLTQVVKEKNRKTRHGSATVVKSILLLLCLIPAVSSYAAIGDDDFRINIPKYVSGIPATDFYFLVAVMALELLVIFALSAYTGILLRIIRDEPELHAKAAAIKRSNWFWDKFNSAASIEKEHDILLDHNYDGIQELDNSLPPWWKYGFYLTILVAFIYLYRFHVSHDGMSQQDEYVAEMQKGEEDKAEYLAKSANNVDENTVTLLTAGIDIANGKETFVKVCAACHLADGGGTVGPNLTDDFWLHGGSVKDIFKSIKYGWQDKGMKSWKDDLSPKQIQELASFIKTLRGTHPATPKAPQGELYIEAQPKEGKADTTKEEKVAVK